MESKPFHVDVGLPFFIYKEKLDIECTKKVVNNPYQNHLNKQVIYCRQTILKKIFSHYKNVMNYFKNKNIKFTVTLVGSEGSISKKFVKDLFADSDFSYVEFDQGGIDVSCSPKEFLDMITNKYQVTYRRSMKKKPNISLLAGSNDYISLNYFEQIIKSYSKETCQIFGFGDFHIYHGNKNVSGLIELDRPIADNEISNMGSYVDLENIPYYDCTFRQETTNDLTYGGQKTDRVEYGGGIIGYNDTLYNYILKDPELFNFISSDEMTMEVDVMLLMKNKYGIDVQRVLTKNAFFLNVKVTPKHNSKDIRVDITNGNDIVEAVKNYNCLVKYSDLSEEMKFRMGNEFINETYLSEVESNEKLYQIYKADIRKLRKKLFKQEQKELSPYYVTQINKLKELLATYYEIEEISEPSKRYLMHVPEDTQELFIRGYLF